VSVQCKKGGVLSGPSNVKQIVTAAPDAPSNQGVAASPKSARIQITPPQALPASGSPWARYQLTLCPVRGPAALCVRRTCTTLSCLVPGLSPATTYVVQTVAVAEDGSQSVPSNEAPFTTPSQPDTPPNPHAEAKGPTEAELM
jgi:chitodextrinase